MMVTTLGALGMLVGRYADAGQWSLLTADLALMALSAALVVLALHRLATRKARA